jgi:hypothetical protein
MSTYTTRHYQNIACLLKACLKDDRKIYDKKTVNAIALDFAGVFAVDNELFDASKFLKACGVRT